MNTPTTQRSEQTKLQQYVEMLTTIARERELHDLADYIAAYPAATAIQATQMKIDSGLPPADRIAPPPYTNVTAKPRYGEVAEIDPVYTKALGTPVYKITVMPEAVCDGCQ